MGIIVGLINAATVGLLDVFLKKLKGLNPNFLTLLRMASAVPALAILVTVFSRWTIPPRPFWMLVLLVSVPLEIFLAFLTTKALQMAPLSLMAPLGAFSSIFLIPVGYLVLGELPTRLGVVGVLLIFIGSFFLGWKVSEDKLRYGLSNVLREPGSYVAILGAFVASITVTVAKFTFHYAPPLLSAFYLTSLMGLALLPLLFMQSRGAIRMRGRDVLGLMVMSGSGIALHYTGLSLISMVYYISIKRLSTVINVVWGRLFFREDHTRERLAGAAFMAAGVILIAFAS